MSWMDSWSRPKKSSATPPPLYLTSGSDVPYCHTCGRVIGSRKANTSKATSATAVKYCSDRCKRNKPSSAPDSVDKRIDDVFVALLEGREPPKTQMPDSEETAPAPASNRKAQTKGKKGDRRIIVTLSEVETIVFGGRQDPEKVFGRKKNRARRGVPDGDTWKSVDMVEDVAQARETEDGTDTDTAGSAIDEGHSDEGGAKLPDMVNLRIRPPQDQSEVNGSIGGEKGWAERQEETPEMLQKRREGQKRAEEKELVKCAARRAVAFGLLVDQDAEIAPAKGRKKKDGELEEAKQVQKKCEAVMNGAVVEPSFAKGDWAIRWREEW